MCFLAGMPIDHDRNSYNSMWLVTGFHCSSPPNCRWLCFALVRHNRWPFIFDQTHLIMFWIEIPYCFFFLTFSVVCLQSLCRCHWVFKPSSLSTCQMWFCHNHRLQEMTSDSISIWSCVFMCVQTKKNAQGVSVLMSTGDLKNYLM